MLVVKNTTNNTMYAMQELHIFLKHSRELHLRELHSMELNLMELYLKFHFHNIFTTLIN